LRTAGAYRVGAVGLSLLLPWYRILVVSYRLWDGITYSYPTTIQLPAPEVKRIRNRTEPYQYQRLYGGWCKRVVIQSAQDAVARSAERYIRALKSVPQS